MKPDNMKSVPVDPNNPEPPIRLLPQAVQYLVDEMGRLHSLAADADRCETGYARACLVHDLAERLDRYRGRGLMALVNITNELVDQYDPPPPVKAPGETPEPKPKPEPKPEPKGGQPDAKAEADAS